MIPRVTSKIITQNIVKETRKLMCVLEHMFNKKRKQWWKNRGKKDVDKRKQTLKTVDVNSTFQ